MLYTAGLLPVLFIACVLTAQIETARELVFDPAIKVRVASGAEWDTNAKRAISGTSAGLGPSTIPTDVTEDGLVRVLGELDFNLAITPSDSLELSYVIGAKRFFQESTEDLLVHDLGVSTRHDFIEALRLELWGRGRAHRIRSGLRSYGLIFGGGTFGVAPISNLLFKIRSHYTRFSFDSESRLNFRGPTIGAEIDWTPFERTYVQVFADHGWRAYNSSAVVSVNVDGNTVLTFCDGNDSVDLDLCTQIPRDDTEVVTGLRASYQKGFLLGGELSLRLQRSTSLVEHVDRYRASIFGTVPLPVLDLLLSFLGVLQYNRGLSVTEATFPIEDDENQNRLEIQLSRRLTSELSVELRYALFANEFATSQQGFLRQTFYLGLSYDYPGET